MSKSDQQNQLDQQQKMVRGTMWSTIADFTSRILGAIYIIPWYAWMGKYGAEANALFSMGYNIYAMFLLISTSGLNVAISKQISKYNTLGKEEQAMKLVQGFMKFSSVLGVVFSAAMYFGAPIFAQLSGGTEELIPVIRSLAPAVLVFPAMSIIRGVFQGYMNMKPYALSQISEQLIRVIWMLLTAFFIMKMGSGDYHEAVVQSTFAAFIGMIASVAVLMFYLVKADLFKPIFLKSYKSVEVHSLTLLVETVKVAIPFVVVGSAVQIFQLIDQATFVNAMEYFTNFDRKELVIMFSYFSANPNKIVMILISVASSIGGVGIALLTENYVKKDMRAAASLVINNLQLCMLFLFPAITGVILLANPVYTFFYGQPSELALLLFIAVLFQTILVGFYSLLAPMLQALFQSRLAIRYFIIGLIIKVVLQIPFIYFFHSLGPVLSTSFALLVPVVLMYNRIQKVTRFNRRLVVKHTLLILIMTAVMAFVVAIFKGVLGLFLPMEGRIAGTIYMIICGGVGVAVYAYLALFTRMLDKLIGARAKGLRQKLRIP